MPFIIPATVMNTLLVIFVIGRLFRTRKRKRGIIVKMEVSDKIKSIPAI